MVRMIAVSAALFALLLAPLNGAVAGPSTTDAARPGPVKVCKDTYWETIKVKRMTCRAGNKLLDRGIAKLNKRDTKSVRVGKNYRCYLPYYPYWDAIFCTHVNKPKKKWAKVFGE